jgi:hypothetical protein
MRVRGERSKESKYTNNLYARSRAIGGFAKRTQLLQGSIRGPEHVRYV